MRSIVVCAVSSLLGCGSGPGWLDGKVEGNEVSVKEAVYVQDPYGGVYIAAADQKNLCAIVNGQQKPSGDMNVLEIFLVNWDGDHVQPLVTGTYTPTQQVPVAPGRFAFTNLWRMRECDPETVTTARRGTISLESMSPPDGQTVVWVDLAFGSEPMTGRLVASHCARTESGSPCYLHLRSPPPTAE